MARRLRVSSSRLKGLRHRRSQLRRAGPRLTVDVPHRGELCTADVPGDKRRPVLILTRSSFLQRLNNVTVAPVVTRVREIPTEIVVDSSHGIDHRSAVSFDNILTIPQGQLLQRIGQLSDLEMIDACDAISLALGCVHSPVW